MNDAPFIRSNPFESAKLSPLPKTPLACALPFELTWDDLRACLPGFDKHADDHAQAFETYEKQGLNGGPNSCILTLHYPSVEKQLRSETVFIKRITEPWEMEAQKYRYLASQGIPTPRLLADIHKGSTEIIMLEFLPTIGIDFHSYSEVENLLHLAAQLNSIQNPPDFITTKPRLPQSEFDELVRGVLTEMSGDRALPFTIDVIRWFEAYQIVQKDCLSLPTALNHNQFFFQQMGWAQREHTRQLVLFDLETMSLAPRFSDIAGILKPLATYTGRDQLELFKIYFDRACQLNLLELGFDRALHEVKLVQALDAFCSLPWLFESRDSGISAIIDTTPVMAVVGLSHDLMALGLI